MKKKFKKNQKVTTKAHAGFELGMYKGCTSPTLYQPGYGVGCVLSFKFNKTKCCFDQKSAIFDDVLFYLKMQ